MNPWDPALLAAIAVRTAVVFIFLIVSLRLTGKRQIGEMNIHDLLMILVVSNAVQNAMSRQNSHVSVALVSAGTLIALGWLLGTLVSRHPTWEPWLLGVPTVLVENGKLIGRHLRQQGLSKDDLMSAVRGQGLAGLDGVRLAVLEINGTISVIPREPSHSG